MNRVLALAVYFLFMKPESTRLISPNGFFPRSLLIHVSLL